MINVFYQETFLAPLLAEFKVHMMVSFRRCRRKSIVHLEFWITGMYACSQ